MLELNLDFGSTDSALEKLKNSKNRLSRDQIRQKNAQKESRSKFSKSSVLIGSPILANSGTLNQKNPKFPADLCKTHPIFRNFNFPGMSHTDSWQTHPKKIRR